MRVFDTYKKQLEIKTTGPEQALSDLSGGNQQKFVLAKWLCADPKLIILDEPTRGIDIGSKSAIHELIAGLAENGLAVIVISSEMPEVLGVSHRILTMSEGRMVGQFSGVEMTEKNLIEAVSHRADDVLTPV
jgi:ribose transport system ATP-binding protein